MLRTAAEMERAVLRQPVVFIVEGPGGKGSAAKKAQVDGKVLQLCKKFQLDGLRICLVLAPVIERLLLAGGVDYEAIESLEELNSKVIPFQNKIQYVIAPCTSSSMPSSTSALEMATYSLIRSCALQVALSPSSSVPTIFSDVSDLLAFVDNGFQLQSQLPAKQLASICLLSCSQRDQKLAAKLAVTTPKRVLIIGSGGREHALALTIAKSLQVESVMVSPGNGGTALAGGKISNVEVPGDNKALVAYALQHSISLVVVGPEQPLVDGLVDAMDEAGVACFGPSAAAARLEASKAFSKDFMKRHDIRTAKYETFTDFSAAKDYILSISHRVVVKASGLAAGKGVLMPETQEQTLEAVRSIMVDGIFGSAGAEVVIEEFLVGEELSLLAFCDGKHAVAMPGAQDHKRVFDNDQGPNTGGMGAYAPAPILTPALLTSCMAIIQKTVDKMAEEGAPYKGVLYAGFMICKNHAGTGYEPVVLEYNCRFGDPETQVLMPLLDSDLFDIMMSCVAGRLWPGTVHFSKNASCTVVCAAPGYPDAYAKGLPIAGLEAASAIKNVTVFHAGTVATADRSACTSGGRVMAVTGLGSDLTSAVATAYRGVSAVSFPGMHYRKDIAAKGLNAPLVLGVIGSTRGTAMQAVIDAIEAGTLHAKISLVVSNKKDAGILERATKHGIENVYISSTGLSREEYDHKVCAALEQYGVQLVLMIGYMRIVSSVFIDKYRNKCMNVHPSLLPDFAGGMDLQVHTDVIKAGKTKSGCTIHFVTEKVDGGPIVLQEECAVEDGETPESLKAKVQLLEGAAFCKAVEMYRNRATDSVGKEIITYRAAGVDIDAGEDLVEAIKPMCKATRRAGCDADLGGFGGLFDLSLAGYDAKETILVSGTDGVGTKLKIAHAVGIHDTIGIDLVAMCVNDILVCGAEPLFFLDYYATGALEVPTAALVVKGIAEGCRQSGAALIGGETAEMAGMYAKGEYDLAGFSVGAVKRQDILPQGVAAGDALIGLKSSGIHSNGYSLVRKCVEKSGLSWEDAAPFDEAGRALGAALLTPTRIYVSTLLPLVKAGLIKGMAHITGGGLLDNLPRVLPDGICAVIEAEAAGWQLPPVFKWLQSLCNLPQHELLRTFNCGIGMVVVVAADKLDEVNALLVANGEEDYFQNLGYLQKRAQGDNGVVDGPQVIVNGIVQ